MGNNQDIEFIKKCIEKWYNNSSLMSLELESKDLLGYTIEDGGVPKEMEDGTPDHEGYVKWKPIPSNINETEIQALEREYGISFPQLYRSYLMSYYHLGIRVKMEKINISLPEIPSDNPFKEIRFELEAWKPLVNVGYLPFGDYGDGWGPICFDFLSLDQNGDAPIIWFDHEELFNMDFEEGKPRTELDIIKKDLYSSFQEFLKKMF